MLMSRTLLLTGKIALKKDEKVVDREKTSLIDFWIVKDASVSCNGERELKARMIIWIL